ncbi:hypothetical protein LTR66_008426 [Elasticomyces elasticus]|nr:hypothetical protein LTR66_008426 [Elasticomyces elasticus]KAK5006527.1 hypothetical protein LTR28_006390 [Elasticomyces elasticus]
MSPARSLLVTGATGKQGGALISALLSKPNQPFEIYALTRNTASRSAQALASKPGTKLVKGDLEDCPAIFREIEKPWGVFSVQLPLPNAKVEEKRGKALTDAAIKAGVRHLVYTSGDRGGNERSERDPTNVPHFVSKYNIEKDIREKADASKQGMTWTILRPVAFMENLTPDFIGKAFATLWWLNGADQKLQLISTVDIGIVAAEAFLNAESEEFRNKAISLAGDELAPVDANAIFKKQVGADMPTTYSFVGRLIRFGLKEQLGLMFDWFKAQGFGADVAGLKKRYPGTQDFSTWLRETSKFGK